MKSYLGIILFLGFILSSLYVAGCTSCNPDIENTPSLPQPAPTVASTLPMDQAVDIPVDQAIQITFSIAMTTDKGTLTVVDGLERMIDYSEAWDTDKKVLTVTPTEPLPNDITITVTVSTDFRSADGVALEKSVSFSFATIPVDPCQIDTIKPLVASSLEPVVLAESFTDYIYVLQFSEPVDNVSETSFLIDSNALFSLTEITDENVPNAYELYLYNMVVGQEYHLSINPSEATNLTPIADPCKNTLEPQTLVIQVECDTTAPSMTSGANHFLVDTDPNTHIYLLTFSEPVYLDMKYVGSAFPTKPIIAPKEVIYTIRSTDLNGNEQIKDYAQEYTVFFQIAEWDPLNFTYPMVISNRITDVCMNSLDQSYTLEIQTVFCALDMDTASVTSGERYLFDPLIKTPVTIKLSEPVTNLESVVSVTHVFGPTVDTDLSYTITPHSDGTQFDLDFPSANWVDQSADSGDEDVFKITINSGLSDLCGNATENPIFLTIETKNPCHTNFSVPHITSKITQEFKAGIVPFMVSLTFDKPVKGVSDFVSCVQTVGINDMDADTTFAVEKVNLQSYFLNFNAANWEDGDQFNVIIPTGASAAEGVVDYCDRALEGFNEIAITYTDPCIGDQTPPELSGTEQVFSKGTHEGIAVIRFSEPVIIADSGMIFSGDGNGYLVGKPAITMVEPYDNTTYNITFTGVLDGEVYTLTFPQSTVTDGCGNQLGGGDAVMTLRILDKAYGNLCDVPFDLSGKTGYWYVIPGLFSDDVDSWKPACSLASGNSTLNVFWAKFTSRVGVGYLEVQVKDQWGPLTLVTYKANSANICENIPFYVEEISCSPYGSDFNGFMVDPDVSETYFLMAYNNSPSSAGVLNPQFNIHEIDCETYQTELIADQLIPAQNATEVPKDSLIKWSMNSSMKTNEGTIVLLANDVPLVTYDLSLGVSSDILTVINWEGRSDWQLKYPSGLPLSSQIVVQMNLVTDICTKATSVSYTFSTTDCTIPHARPVMLVPEEGGISIAPDTLVTILFDKRMDTTKGTILLYADSILVKTYTLPDAAVTWNHEEQIVTIAYNAGFPGESAINVAFTLYGLECQQTYAENFPFETELCTANPATMELLSPVATYDPVSHWYLNTPPVENLIFYFSKPMEPWKGFISYYLDDNFQYNIDLTVQPGLVTWDATFTRVYVQVLQMDPYTLEKYAGPIPAGSLAKIEFNNVEDKMCHNKSSHSVVMDVTGSANPVGEDCGFPIPIKEGLNIRYWEAVNLDYAADALPCLGGTFLAQYDLVFSYQAMATGTLVLSIPDKTYMYAYQDGCGILSNLVGYSCQEGATDFDMLVYTGNMYYIYAVATKENTVVRELDNPIEFVATFTPAVECVTSGVSGFNYYVESESIGSGINANGSLTTTEDLDPSWALTYDGDHVLISGKLENEVSPGTGDDFYQLYLLGDSENYFTVQATLCVDFGFQNHITLGAWDEQGVLLAPIAERSTNESVTLTFLIQDQFDFYTNFFLGVQEKEPNFILRDYTLFVEVIDETLLQKEAITFSPNLTIQNNHACCFDQDDPNCSSASFPYVILQAGTIYSMESTVDVIADEMQSVALLIKYRDNHSGGYDPICVDLTPGTNRFILDFKGMSMDGILEMKAAYESGTGSAVLLNWSTTIYYQPS